MTEQEWLGCAEPTAMLQFLAGKASDRKQRLFMVSCCRRVWSYFDSRQQGVVEVAERLADSAASPAEVQRSMFAAIPGPPPGYLHAQTSFEAIGLSIAVDDRLAPAEGARYWAKCVDHSILPEQQTALLKEIFGNPFRPVTFDPAWLTPTVIALARAIYEGRRFADLPILADALEEAGCTNRNLLSHCRTPGEHVLGCWAVDLILGKS